MVSKILFCKNCQRYRAFYDKGDKYVCVGCKFEIKKDIELKDKK
jgi:hypothetical protein